MEGVEQVTQVDDRRSHWLTDFHGRKQGLTLKSRNRFPDQRIAWRSTSGRSHGGVVTFHHL
jgi:uncharacterized membrane protein